MSRFCIGCLVTIAVVLGTVHSASAQPGGPNDPVFLHFETELLALNLTGGPFPIPLANDPGNTLGDSIEGYGFVDSLVEITLSSQRTGTPGPASVGEACAFLRGDVGTADLQLAAAGLQLCSHGDPPPIDPAELDGETFFVDSFFDVFFDITVTDVDDRPGRDYAGQSDGASFQLTDNGPASLQSFYEAQFDRTAPNFGLIPPPEADPYIGHFDIEIPLGGDINGNGEDDKIKFTLASHSVGDENRQFVVLPDGMVLDTFDSAAFLEGAVVDVSTDPPFTIGEDTDPGEGVQPGFGPGGLTGPTMASSTLLNSIVPEPSSLSLWAFIAIGAAVRRKRRRRIG